FSQVQQIWTYYATYLVISIGAGLAGQITLTAVVSRWFIRKRSTAISFALLGGSIGGLLVPLIAIALVNLGWRQTSFISGFVMLAVGLPLAQMFRRAPEEIGLLPDGDTVVEDVRVESEPGQEGQTGAKAAPTRIIFEGFSTKEALHTWSFWAINIGQALALIP